MARRMVSTTAYLDEYQVEALRMLSQRTKVPMAEYVRQGVDLALDRNEPIAGVISRVEDLDDEQSRGS